jgi:Ca2+-transporting ATPase
MKSALRLSPFRSPILLGGALIALLFHLGTMLSPLGQKVLHVEPVSLTTFACLWALALSVFFAMEVHKWTWAMRTQRKTAS